MDSEQHKPQTGASPLHLLVADRMGEAEGSGPDGLLLRMLSIESALYLAAEARGYAVKQGLIIVEGSEIAFEFRERIRASLAPSSKLALKAKSAECHHTKTWNDKVGQPLEKRIAEIVDGLGALGEKVAQWHAECLRGEAEYQQALRDTARRFEKRRERGAKKKRLRGFTSDWIEAENIRAFLDALEARLAASGARPSAAMVEWIAWGRRYVERFDPLSDQGMARLQWHAEALAYEPVDDGEDLPEAWEEFHYGSLKDYIAPEPR